MPSTQGGLIMQDWLAVDLQSLQILPPLEVRVELRTIRSAPASAKVAALATPEVVMVESSISTLELPYTATPAPQPAKSLTSVPSEALFRTMSAPLMAQLLSRMTMALKPEVWDSDSTPAAAVSEISPLMAERADSSEITLPSRMDRAVRQGRPEMALQLPREASFPSPSASWRQLVTVMTTLSAAVQVPSATGTSTPFLVMVSRPVTSLPLTAAPTTTWASPLRLSSVLISATEATFSMTWYSYPGSSRVSTLEPPPSPGPPGPPPSPGGTSVGAARAPVGRAPSASRALSRMDRIFFAFIILPPITDRAVGVCFPGTVSPTFYCTRFPKRPQVNVPKIKFRFL